MTAVSVKTRKDSVVALTISEVDGNFTGLQNAINGIATFDNTLGQFALLSVTCPDPTTALQIANKEYVDNQINKYIGIAAALA
jgi:hypothetical protein